MYKKTPIVLMLVVLLAASTALTAPCGGMRGGRCDGAGPHGGQGRGGFGGPGGILGLATELGLNDMQRSQFEKLALDFRMEMIDQRAAIEKATLNLQNLQRNNAPEAEVSAAIDAAGKLESQAQKARYRHHQQMRAILSPEQQTKLNELRPGMCGQQSGGGPGHGGMGGRPCRLMDQVDDDDVEEGDDD